MTCCCIRIRSTHEGTASIHEVVLYGFALVLCLLIVLPMSWLI